MRVICINLRFCLLATCARDLSLDGVQDEHDNGQHMWDSPVLTGMSLPSSHAVQRQGQSGPWPPPAQGY